MMKVAHFIGTLKIEDGVARSLLAIAEQGRKEGVNSVIITGWVEDKAISSVPIIQVPSVIFLLYRDYRFPIPGIANFEKQLDQFKPDLIHLHSPDPSAWSALNYAKKNDIPIMATHHTDFCQYLPYYHLDFFRHFVWYLLRKLYTQLKIVTTPSRVMGDELFNHKIPNVRVLPWGVEPDRFNPSFRSKELREKILQGKKLILLCVCRLTWEKDLHILAQAYHLLKQRNENFVLVIAGDGPARKRLESMIPQALFTGHLDGKQLSQLYASADIFVFPSTTETFGNVTLEAMASGLVPVVADAGGSKYLVNDKNGFLTKPKDPDDIADKVSILLENEQIRDEMRSSALAFSKAFTWEKAFSMLLKMYQEILRK